jgi:glutathione S-transferase
MSDMSARPTIYAKAGCPFSLKVRLFLLEAGLIDCVDLQIVLGGTLEELQAKESLGAYIEKVTFPTARWPDAVISDSDAIIERLSAEHGVHAENLATFEAYVTGPLPQILALYRENAELKKSCESSGQTNG